MPVTAGAWSEGATMQGWKGALFGKIGQVPESAKMTD